MAYPAKIEQALAILDAAGFSRRRSAPLFHRSLWGWGIPIRPPLFSSFWRHSAFMTVVYIICWTPLLLLGLEKIRGDPRLEIVAGLPIVLGLTYGAFNEWERRKHNLPNWAEIDVADRFD